MSTEGEELDRLETELHAVQAEFRDTVRQMTSLDMMIPAGIKKRRVFQLEVVPLSWIVNLLNLVCFIAGIAFIFLGGVIETVGIALLVGALFSEGAFVGQLWTITAQNSYMVYYRLWGEERFAHLEDLKQRTANLSEQVERLRSEVSPDTPGGRTLRPGDRDQTGMLHRDVPGLGPAG